MNWFKLPTVSENKIKNFLAYLLWVLGIYAILDGFKWWIVSGYQMHRFTALLYENSFIELIGYKISSGDIMYGLVKTLEVIQFLEQIIILIANIIIIFVVWECIKYVAYKIYPKARRS